MTRSCFNDARDAVDKDPCGGALGGCATASAKPLKTSTITIMRCRRLNTPSCCALLIFLLLPNVGTCMPANGVARS